MRFAPFTLLLILCATAQARLDYNFDIRPILSDRCFLCHGPDADNRKAKLRLDTREGAQAVIEDGELMARVTSHDADERMPPPEANLTVSEEEVAKLMQWIEEGYEYKQHWSFEPLDLALAKQPGNSVDTFVGSKLADEGLAFQPEATKETLVRRVAFDLTGLPPTLEEIDAFLADTAADAYENMVDRFLAKPAYGERLASHWMDIARYSDTYGYQVDRDRFVWPWRDWVIGAFNDNKPFDQFVLEQLAGDMLPGATDEQVLATTFNRLHPQKVEGGSVEEEFRVEYVADRLHTYGTAFLGLTLECCRCHDHKYDPIPQKDYYSLFSYFQNIDEAGLYSYFTPSVPTPTLALKDDAKRAEEAKLRAAVDAAQKGLSEVPGLEGRFEKWSGNAQRPELGKPLAHLNFDRETHGKNAGVKGKFGYAVKLTGDDAVTTEVGNFTRTEPFSVSLWIQAPDRKERAVVFHRSKAWTDAASRGYEMLIEDGRLKWSLIHFWPGNAISVRAKDELPLGEWKHVTVSYDGSSSASGLEIYVDGRAADTEVIRDSLTKEIRGGGVDHIRIGARMRDRGFKNGLVDDLKVFAQKLTAGEVANVAKGVEIAPEIDWYRERVDAGYGKARDALKASRDKLTAFENGLQEIMVMREMDVPKPAYVMDRGAYDARGETVEAATLSALPESGASNRLELAQWTVAPDNPLTARVAVNRFWQMCFGQGLVRTPEDFGSQGQLPTHPELLDWLAADFVASGWDLKRLFRMMLTSKTYRQGSSAPAGLVDRDPENRLLARAPRYRLPAEMLRDQWLKTSGLLSAKVGGASVKPYELAQSFKPLAQDKGEGLYRRSLYTFWKRTAPAPVMMALDAAKREVCSVKRERTQTPLQALVLLNDPQMNEAARVFGGKLFEKHGGATEPMLAELFRVATGRAATADEVAILAKTYREQLAVFKADPASAAKLLKVGDAPPVKGLSNEEAAASAVVAAAVLNLWESVGRL